MLPTSALRVGGSTSATLQLLSAASRRSVSLTRPLVAQQQTRANSQAISNPTLANIEHRWEGLPPQEQADLWMALRDRMKVDWHDLTTQEKKAAYWIAFGPHGPRAVDPPGEGWRILRMVVLISSLSVAAFFAVHSFARPPPKTMSKEWQEATDRYLKEENIEPITGWSHVQSKSSGKTIEELTESDDE